MWEKLKLAFRHSLTILWARLLPLGGLLLAFGQSLLGDPIVDDAVRSLLKPDYIPYYMIAIALITELCRRRTAARDN